MNSLAFAIVLVIVMYYLYAHNMVHKKQQYRRVARICPKCDSFNCRHKTDNRFAIEENYLNDATIPKGLHEMSQDTLSRGYVPFQDQPDHVSNMWKVDYSHPYTDDKGRHQTSFSSDLGTPLRINRTHINTCDNSNMHLFTRFAGAN